MNALAAVFITIGAIIALGIVGSIIEIIPWDEVITWGCFLVFLILPTPIMIVGAVTTNPGTMIFAEVLTCIGSWTMTQNRDVSGTWIAFVPIFPTVICLIAFVVSNTVTFAVILVIIGFFQLCAAIGALC